MNSKMNTDLLLKDTTRQKSHCTRVLYIVLYIMLCDSSIDLKEKLNK